MEKVFAASLIDFSNIAFIMYWQSLSRPSHYKD